MICSKEEFGAWKAMAGALLGISVAFVDFDNLAWSLNMKGYFGFFIAIVMFVSIIIVQKIKKLNNELAE